MQPASGSMEIVRRPKLSNNEVVVPDREEL
jgi:hypothetical protein